MREELYRVDRMLTQLKLAGVLGKIKGFVFGSCSECGPGDGNYGALTLEEIFSDHIKPLGVPAWQGAMIGHAQPQWTLPEGAQVEIDATAATITLLEAPVALISAVSGQRALRRTGRMTSPSWIASTPPCRRDHAGEDGVVEVQPRVVDQVDEELRVRRVPAARRQPDRAAAVPRPDLVAHVFLVPGVLVRAGAAALDDEVRARRDGWSVRRSSDRSSASFRKRSTVIGRRRRIHEQRERLPDAS